MLSLWLCLSVLCSIACGGNITVDWPNDRFLKDGSPYRYISGGMHYFRVPPQLWRDRLHKMQLAGLDTLQTYVAWNGHEPQEGQYQFGGRYNLTSYLALAQEMGFNVILRPGPYICAEWDFGGLPYWLLNKQGIEFRVYNEQYVMAIAKWFRVLLPMVEPFLYRNGGPILTVQLENEYAGFGTDVCDKNYLQFLLDQLRSYLGEDVIYYTLDNKNVNRLACGNLPGLLKALDFGPDKIPHYQFSMLRKYQPHGPLVNAEFWTGWFDEWGNGKHANVSAAKVGERLDEMLALNASVNLYMFEGGTNFGYSNGAMSRDGYAYNTRVTSYDYDAVLSEAGDTTPKYWAVRRTLQKYRPLPPGPVPPHSAKWAGGPYKLGPVASLWSLGRCEGEQELPVTMEQFNQSGGFIWYQMEWSGPLLNVSLFDVHDRATLFLDGKKAGTIDRRTQANGTITILTAPNVSEVRILVENLGRVNHGRHMGSDYKGITEKILINGEEVKRAEVCLLDPLHIKMPREMESTAPIPAPALYCGKFVGPPKRKDSFLDPTGWEHGFAILNQENLGRYWPGEGPQVTLYAPGVYLTGLNTLCMLEIDVVGETVSFVAKPNLGSGGNTLNF